MTENVPRPKVSVVVPIYKVERYLRQCVDSILAQTLRDIEIILVDDGSPDNCPEIVDQYAANDPRIVAVHQANAGYGRAVNHGIEIARGEYIGIVESDDWIEPDMYQKLLQNAVKNATDITKCGFYQYNSQLPPAQQNTPWKARNNDIMLAPDSVFDITGFPLLLAFHPSVWAAVYKAEFIKQIRFVETVGASYQDFPFMVESFCRAKRISVVREYLVHYRVEDDQGSSSLRRDERLLMIPRQSLVCRDILKRYGLYDALKEEFYIHAFSSNTIFYFQIDHRLRKQYFREMQAVFEEVKTDSGFTFRHFNRRQKKTLLDIMNGRYFSTNLTFWRRYIFGLRVRKDFLFLQLFGVQLSLGRCPVRRPAWISVRLMKNGWNNA